MLLSAEELQQLVEAFHAGSERFALTALTYAQSERALQRLFTIDEAHTRYTIHELVTVETAWARNGEERAPTSASRFTRGTDRQLRTQECVWESLTGSLGRNRVLPTRRLCSRIA